MSVPDACERGGCCRSRARVRAGGARISKRFGAVQALHDVSFRSTGRGGRVIGDNGAGKSTLVNIIAGSLSRRRQILVDGVARRSKTPPRPEKRGSRPSFNTFVDPTLDMAENVFLNRELFGFGQVATGCAGWTKGRCGGRRQTASPGLV